jgi:hypothetical protein
VNLNDAGPVDVSTSAVLDTYDVASADHVTCCPAGDTKTLPQGWSMVEIIEAAGAAVARTMSIAIERGGHRLPIPLSPADFDPARGPGGALDFLDGDAAFVYLKSSAYSFFRPQHTTHDKNFKDWLTPAVGSPLVIDIAAGNILAVTASATPTSAVPGGSITFGESVTGALAGENLTYAWSFTDGTTATGASVAHTFTGTGTYQATVSVTGDRLSGGSDTVTVTVGESPSTTGPGGSSTTGAPVAGGTTTTTVHGPPSSHPGSGGTGTTGPTTRGTPGSVPRGTAVSSSVTGSESGQPAPTSAVPQLPASSVPPSSAPESATTAAGTIPTTAPPPSTSAPPATTQPLAGTAIRGELLDVSGAVPAGAAALANASAVPPPRQALGSNGTDIGGLDRRWWGWVLAAMGAAALFFAGACNESRWMTERVRSGTGPRRDSTP